jgi:3-isopropylmalate dehydrogenase
VLKIAVLEGDDIGLEVVPECVKVIKAAAAKSGLAIEWLPLPIGRRAHDSHGHTLPQVTLEALRGVDGWIQGPIGHNAYPRNDPTWINPPLRKQFELFANVKPVKSYPNLPSLHKDVDIVFLREVTEGMQSASVVLAGSGEFRPNDDISIGMRVVTRKGASRVAREAFEIARTRRRRKVTAVHKEPIFKLVCGMFAEECRKVAKQYPDVELEEALVDGFAMKLVMKPQQYDVVVTTNQFGDILTDEGAGLVGGLGLAPGLCVGERQAMAQATHGSAPDIAGQGIANPYAMIVSGKMLLEWLGRKRGEPAATEAARRIDVAVERVIAEARHLTRDLGGTARTADMGDAIAAAIP